MSQGARNLAFLVALAAIVGVLAWGLSARTRGPRDLLGSAPARAAILAEIDVAPLRRSPLFRDLVGQSDAGLERIEETCGLDPLASLRTVQVFVLRGEDADDATLERVAFLARGPLEHEALVRCVEQVVEGDGGGVHPTSIEGIDAIASDHGSSVAAFLGTDGVVAGDDVVVAEILRIQSGASPPRERDAALARLFGRAGAASHVRVVAALPPRWQRWLGRLEALVGDDVPLERARALSLGASLEEGIALSLWLDLGSPEAARAAEEALEASIGDARRDPELAASALAIALANVRISAQGGDLGAEAHLSRPELDATIALARRYLAREAAAAGE